MWETRCEVWKEKKIQESEDKLDCSRLVQSTRPSRHECFFIGSSVARHVRSRKEEDTTKVPPYLRDRPVSSMVKEMLQADKMVLES